MVRNTKDPYRSYRPICVVCNKIIKGEKAWGKPPFYMHRFCWYMHNKLNILAVWLIVVITVLIIIAI